jgi:hypothetical protein
LTGCGFAIADIESIVPGRGEYETWNPATAMPVIGTDICGFPREGVSESFTGSHVDSDGCLLKSVNHSHDDNEVQSRQR